MSTTTEDLQRRPANQKVDATPSRVPRRPLDQMRILRAAVDFIDVNGLAKLTMRRLGAHLG